MLTHLTPISTNRKTGPIPVSTSSRITCPDSCPFKKSGCYAKAGQMNFHWNKVSNGLRGDDWNTFCSKISNLPRKQIWRHNQAGDLPGINEEIDGKQLNQLVVANKGKRGFTYTHKPMFGKYAMRNRKAIRGANSDGFTINLSANGIGEVDKLVDLGIAPVVTVMPKDWSGTSYTEKGRKVIQCPATRENSFITCASCQLCQKQRSAVVGFPAHGTAKNIATRISENA